MSDGTRDTYRTPPLYGHAGIHKMCQWLGVDVGRLTPRELRHLFYLYVMFRGTNRGLS